MAPRAVFVSCVCACATFVFLTLVTPAALIAYFLVGFTVGPILPTLVALAAQQARNVDRATASIFLAEATGNIIMPMLIGGIVVRASALCLPFVAAAAASQILVVTRTLVKTPKMTEGSVGATHADPLQVG